MVRPTKSTTELKLAGTFRKDRHSDRGENLVVSGKPLKPKHLTGDGGKLWNSLVKQLIASKVVGKVDEPMLIALCELWSLYRSALEIAQNNPIDKDARIAATSYFASFERAASGFGLTPSSRAKLTIELDDKPKPVASRNRTA